MTDGNVQYLERLAEVSREFGRKEELPEDSRLLFSEAFGLAEDCQYGDAAERRVDQAFTVLCAACKAAGLHQCKSGGLLSCRLVWDYDS